MAEKPVVAAPVVTPEAAEAAPPGTAGLEISEVSDPAEVEAEVEAAPAERADEVAAERAAKPAADPLVELGLTLADGKPDAEKIGNIVKNGALYQHNLRQVDQILTEDPEARVAYWSALHKRGMLPAHLVPRLEADRAALSGKAAAAAPAEMTAEQVNTKYQELLRTPGKEREAAELLYDWKNGATRKELETLKAELATSKAERAANEARDKQAAQQAANLREVKQVAEDYPDVFAVANNRIVAKDAAVYAAFKAKADANPAMSLEDCMVAVLHKAGKLGRASAAAAPPRNAPAPLGSALGRRAPPAPQAQRPAVEKGLGTLELTEAVDE